MKAQMPEPQTPSVRFRRSGALPENLHSLAHAQVRLLLWTHAVRTTDLEIRYLWFQEVRGAPVASHALWAVGGSMDHT